ncbi:Tat (twin-arginine translocation) pathway signal sequence [Bryocella elongata]|uniref:Tat (Twin-arginine translocation) pathway signal sequence n=1 Tax=Bryocella elongata TaxID=863522 RepID=A0A1H5WX66_9BACT|nr:ferritin-like domain-containing protein [Bryocella elongata]SEG03885.1 Tat (twin-arginine translocation) pathway signal sequence [Bryocella elongata]
MQPKISSLIDKALSRRSFLTGVSAVAAGTVLAGCGDNSTPVTSTPTTPTALTDADYLNFALNLEYLEAEFYLRAATGSGLAAADTGNSTSKTTGGAAVSGLTSVQSQYIYEIAQNELDHVRFLRSALGSSAVAAPTIELTASFNTLASAAGLGASFNPFLNFSNFLIGAFIFEDVGVTAYHGAAKLLTSKTNLTAAAEIMAVEAYHAGSIRSQIVASGSSLISTANAVSGVRSSLGGGNETTLSATSVVAASATTSIAFDRTTDQVLHIVYGTGGGAGVKGGVFFPSGLNGNISVTAA